MKNSTEDEVISAAAIYDSYLEEDYVVMGLYVVVFLLAFTANIGVIIVVFKDNYMRSVTNYFLVNLSVADLLVTLVCMPHAALLAYTAADYFGSYVCKISAYLQCISVASSIFTITAMAVDRYLAIARPLFGFVYRSSNKSTVLAVIAALWLLSFLLFAPVLYIYGLKVDVYPTPEANVTVGVCKEDWMQVDLSRRAVGIVWFVFMFAVPGAIMIFAYSVMGRTLCSGKPPLDNDSTSNQQRNKLIKGRKRVACILLLLAFVFAVCWLPHHIMTLMADTGNPIKYALAKKVRRYLLLLGHANSAMNPIIYCTLSKKFRTSMINSFLVKMTSSRKQHLNMKRGDSSGSATQLHFLQRLNNPSLRSSQKTKTFAL
ncbi:unnamed protein product [Phaedon cochleariae]|uniref:G-protein coupled receptors family 1 profile domain-containing protein n=1 Tax=Phaedon cochleariae TaxID=80249 RepID=A0A9P0DK79_PHACE|nr:unnamed protein product [Phaedon cochleariae]